MSDFDFQLHSGSDLLLGDIVFVFAFAVFVFVLWWRPFPSDLKLNICRQDETILSIVSLKLLRMVLVL